MKVLVLTGSPHKAGTTAMMADSFCEGAKSAGHDVVRYNVAFAKIAPCLGCDYCKNNNSTCVHKDEMPEISAQLKDADVLALVSPLYYFGMTAQLKDCVDRFYSVNDEVMGQKKKVVLLCAGGDDEEWAFAPLQNHVGVICRYLKWEEGGSVCALGCSDRNDLEKTDYPRQCRHLGATL